MTHFALAFEVPGGWLKEKDAMTLTVIQVFNFHATIELLFTIPFWCRFVKKFIVKCVNGFA